MQQLNRIELKGQVGSVRVQTALERKVAHISVVTNYAYKDRNGMPVIESTWHNVTVWEGKDVPDLDSITKGDKIWVVGRQRNQKYTASDGSEKTSTEVAAYKVSLIDSDDPMTADC